MSEQLTETVPSSAPAFEPRRRRPRTDWRQGGRAVRKWNGIVLAVALMGVGIGVIVGALVSRVPAEWASVGSSVALWIGMLAAIAFAFARSRPAGLLRFRAVDLLWGLGFGLALRLCQGWLSGADAAAFPSVVTLDGALPSSWWLVDAVPAIVIAPMVEEFFFRAVVLVAVYQLLRRSSGGAAAGFAALLVSTGGFVMLHATAGSLSLAEGAQLFAVGAVCSLLVLLTGRIWPAVIAHVVYNALYIALVVAGTALA